MSLSVYLFETKSIQAYLARTGRLEDIIDLSDQLGRLIDDNDESVLASVVRVLEENEGITSNLLVEDKEKDDADIIFFRCKGGSFGCFAKNREHLVSLRKLWTLVFQQSFPYMAFADALDDTTSNPFDLNRLLDSAYAKLGEAANTPTISLPYASTVVRSCSRTGEAAIKQDLKKSQALDMATVASLKAKKNNNADLYKKFLNKSEELKTYKNAFIKAYNLVYGETAKNNAENDLGSDVALIHIDGNGIGQALISLREKLNDLVAKAGDHGYLEYSKIMRKFSDAIGAATAKSVTYALNKTEKMKNKKGDEVIHGDKLIFRPLVLGGDDVTLFMEPAWAGDFCVNYCKTFKDRSKEELQKLNKELKSKLPDFKLNGLSASGGLLFAKIRHPYSNSIGLTEGLCELAKKLTKNEKSKLSRNNNQSTQTEAIGPAAIAFFRVSAATSDSISDVIKRSTEFSIKSGEHSGKTIKTGKFAFLVEDPINPSTPKKADKLELCEILCLEDLLTYVRDKIPSYSLSGSSDEGNNSSQGKNPLEGITGTYRRMITALAAKDFDEAFHLHKRANDVRSDKKKLGHLEENATNYDKWFKKESDESELISSIYDVLIMHHYMKEQPKLDEIKEADKEELNQQVNPEPRVEGELDA